MFSSYLDMYRQPGRPRFAQTFIVSILALFILVSYSTLLGINSFKQQSQALDYNLRAQADDRVPILALVLTVTG